MGNLLNLLLGNQNDTRVSRFKTIIEEIKGFNSFLKEMLSIGHVEWMKEKLLADQFIEDTFGYIKESVLELTESSLSMEVEEIVSLIQSLDTLYSIVDSWEPSTEEIPTWSRTLAKIEDLQETIVKLGRQAKVKEMKQRIEQARSAAKKVAVKDKYWWWW